MRNFRELNIWKEAVILVKEIYRLSNQLPEEEKYGLKSQICRAAISIPSNIAEGYGRKTIPDYVRCLYIAYGSTCELETQTLLSGDLSYLNKADQSSLLEKIKEVERMLMALIKSLENKNNS